MKKFTTALAVLAGALLMATDAHAATLITGSQAFGGTAVSGTLDTSYTMTLLTNTGGDSQSGDFIGFPSGGDSSTLDPTTLTVASLGTFSTGNATFGTFAASSGSLTGGFDGPGVSVRTYTLSGLFTPGSSSVFSGLSPNAAVMTVTVTKVGSTYSASASLQAVPEPATLVMLATAFGPLGAFGWRRRRATRK